MSMIVGHVSPDWDCLTALWLLRRFDPALENATIKLVNTGNPDAAILAEADAVVDTGRVCNYTTKRYDHHQMDDPNSTSAALLVYEHLLQMNNNLSYLAPLVRLIFAGDTGKSDADESRKTGIHAILSQMKHDQYNDETIMLHCFPILDAIETQLEYGSSLDVSIKNALLFGYDVYIKRYQERQNALIEQGIEPYVVYRSKDSRVIALQNAPQQATQLAFEQGASLVVWANYPENAIGVNRARGIDTHLGELIDNLQELVRLYNHHLSYQSIEVELSTWYRHAAGFFAGRGTAKASREDPIVIELAELAQLVDMAWWR